MRSDGLIRWRERIGDPNRRRRSLPHPKLRQLPRIPRPGNQFQTQMIFRMHINSAQPPLTFTSTFTTSKPSQTPLIPNYSRPNNTHSTNHPTHVNTETSSPYHQIPPPNQITSSYHSNHILNPCQNIIIIPFQTFHSHDHWKTDFGQRARNRREKTQCIFISRILYYRIQKKILPSNFPSK